jgi:hypothetical protein
MRSLRSVFLRPCGSARRRFTDALAMAGLVGLFFGALVPTPALAQISHFTADFSTVLQDCKNAKGVWSDDDGGYGCTKPNCDGKGGSCTVGCTRDKECTGSTPKIMVGKVTILMLLQNGSNVDHSVDAAEPSHGSSGPQTSGSGGAAGGAVGGPPSFF